MVSFLIGILHIALILGHEGGHDGIVGLAHHGGDVLGSPANGIDGLVDGERQGMPPDETTVAHAGHDIERAVDGHRHDGQLQLVGQGKGTAAEMAHVACERAAALGEDGEAGAALQGGTGTVVGLLDFLGASLVDEDLMRLRAGIAHEGHLAQLLLHHPLEVAAEIAVDEEDVEGALVVGHEDIALVALEMLTPLDANGDEQHSEDETRPPAAWVVAPVMAVEEGAADGYSQRYHDGGKDDERQRDEQLIDLV